MNMRKIIWYSGTDIEIGVKIKKKELKNCWNE